MRTSILPLLAPLLLASRGLPDDPPTRPPAQVESGTLADGAVAGRAAGRVERHVAAVS